jgi:hypothetical protein
MPITVPLATISTCMIFQDLHQKDCSTSNRWNYQADCEDYHDAQLLMSPTAVKVAMPH